MLPLVQGVMDSRHRKQRRVTREDSKLCSMGHSGRPALVLSVLLGD